MQTDVDPDTIDGHPFTMDGHEDALYYAQAHGGPGAFDAGIPDSQLDGPGLRAGGVDAAFWAIFAPGEVAEAHDQAATAREVDALLADYRAWIDGSDGYRLLLGPADLDATAEAAGAGAGAPFGALLHLEGARGLAGPAHLAALHAGGLRSVGLTWNRANAYATGAFGDPATGLTPAGASLVRELNRLRMAIDGAHLNRQGLWDVLDTSDPPILVTHTGCAALHADPRNLADDQMRAVAERGGVIGIFHVNIFLAAAGAPVTLDTVLAHFDHALEVVGPDHVALGTDYGGVSSGLPAGLERVGALPRLYDAFVARGYSAATIAAIRGGNYRRALRAILA